MRKIIINITKKHFVLILLFSLSFGFFGMVSPTRGAISTKDLQTSATDSDIISILVYTEYADATGEFVNTISAIDTYYGRNYNYDTLNNYSALASEISNYDVFLILEQENGSPTQMKTVGEAWASILSTYLDNGGLVICLDWAFGFSYGSTRNILNSSNIMEFDETVSSITGETIKLASSSSDLTIGVSSSWAAPDGALNVSTTDGNVIVEDEYSNPVVVHKSWGQGDVVYCGFDFFEIEENCGKILANALRLARSYTPYVLFDESHLNTYSIDAQLQDFANDLLDEGFGVLSMDTFREDLIDVSDVLVLTVCGTVYNSTEISIIDKYVKEGNGVFIVSEFGSFGSELDGVIENFGFIREKVYEIKDSDDNAGSVNCPIFDEENIGGFLSKDLTIELRRTTAFLTIPDGAEVLIATDDDVNSTWVTSGTSARNLPVAAAFETSQGGRVAAIGDTALCINTFYTSSHEEFLIDTIIWLSGASSKSIGGIVGEVPSFPLGITLLTVMVSCAAVMLFIYKKRVR